MFLFSSAFGFQFFLSAQTPEPLTEVSEEASAPVTSPAVDESSIIFGDPVETVTAPAGGSSVFIVFRMVLVLALAALAIYGVVFFIKRMTRPQESRDPHLKVLARTALSGDSFAAVLSVGRKAWLVAGGGGGVNLISEIEEGESLEAMLLDEERKAAEAGNRPFLDFRSLISRFGSSPRQGKDMNSHADGGFLSGKGSLAESLRKQRERLGRH